jgi:hypothetical protein
MRLCRSPRLRDRQRHQRLMRRAGQSGVAEGCKSPPHTLVTHGLPRLLGARFGRKESRLNEGKRVRCASKFRGSPKRVCFFKFCTENVTNTCLATMLLLLQVCCFARCCVAAIFLEALRFGTPTPRCKKSPSTSTSWFSKVLIMKASACEATPDVAERHGELPRVWTVLDDVANVQLVNSVVENTNHRKLFGRFEGRPDDHDGDVERRTAPPDELDMKL